MKNDTLQVAEKIFLYYSYSKTEWNDVCRAAIISKILNSRVLSIVLSTDCERIERNVHTERYTIIVLYFIKAKLETAFLLKIALKLMDICEIWA